MTIELARKPRGLPVEQDARPAQVFVVARRSDIGNIDPGTKRVRLTRQEMFSLSTIREIADRLRLEELHVGPSHASRLLGPSVRKELSARGVAIVVDRMFRRKHYDSSRPNKRSLEEGRKIYTDIPNDPEKFALFRKFDARKFLEVDMARMYYEEDKKMALIAQELGIRPVQVQRRVAAFMHLMGKPVKDRTTLQAVRGLLARLRYCEKSEKEAGEKEKLAVNGQYPPDTLRPSRREMWQKLTRALSRYPEVFVQIKDSVPSWYEAMMVYYQVGEFRGDTRIQDELARGKSGETVRHKKLSCLRLLRSLLAQRGVDL